MSEPMIKEIRGRDFNEKLKEYYDTLKVNVSLEQFKSLAILSLLELLNNTMAFIMKLGLNAELHDTYLDKIAFNSLKFKLANDLTDLIKEMD